MRSYSDLHVNVDEFEKIKVKSDIVISEINRMTHTINTFKKISMVTFVISVISIIVAVLAAKGGLPA